MTFKSVSIKNLVTVGFLSLSVALASCTDADKGVKGNSAEDANLFQKKNITSFHLSGTKKIALTYDDGPTPGVTDELLDVLRQYNIKATFFILGASVRGQEKTLERMRADGHVIANHSYSHQNLREKVYERDADALWKQIVGSDKQIAPYMNPAHKKYFRAPYGAWNATHADKLNAIPQAAEYIGPVFWDAGGEITPRGTRPRSASEITTAADWDCWTANSKKGIYPLSVDVCGAGYYKEISRKQGGVVLMHDKKIQTVQMSAKLIPKLIAEGYEFITVDDIRAMEQYQ
ncbi:polysaccharide deacetylase family protein [Bdellovibrio sp. HCB2-146]|uniref:polysaccharide deacetylase family protein n=1 Tax=Bdellovibrio sp. HCB2-146 TaxID=3394362 RepID=UPI0039BD1242